MPDTAPASPATPWDGRTVPPEVLAGAIVLPEGGYRLRAYQDSAGYWTIGAGSRTLLNGMQVHAGDTITQGAAETLYARQVAGYVPTLERLFPHPLTTSQAAALMSMVHNLGDHALDGSVIQKAIAAGDMAAAVAQFAGWIMARDPKTGRLVPSLGLMHRRHMDALVWAGTAPQAAWQQAYGPHALSYDAGLARYQAACAAARQWGWSDAGASAIKPVAVATRAASAAPDEADALMAAEQARLDGGT